ncbi:MAG: four helix bundle suffix domain-containing protein [Candidatus Cloacimonetes bacterium]|nr:four helix bundle suffix domain-containing protein [Candidatus Cloacimonadota bacterium]
MRQKGLKQWERNNPLRQELLDRNFKTADEVARWIAETCKLQAQADPKITDYQSLYPEHSANAALALINLAGYFLDRQIKKLAEKFKAEGGFTERLYKTRSSTRQFTKKPERSPSSAGSAKSVNKHPADKAD